jgi:predicted metal-dependent HD superfamily phosphohydrolase
MIGFTLKEAFGEIEMPLLTQLSIQQRYNEPHRVYHNQDHIEEMLKWVPRDHPEVRNIIEAIIFHDLTYSPQPVPLGLDESLSVADYMIYTFTGLQHMSTTTNPFVLEGLGSMLNEYKVIEAITATSRHTQDQRHLSDVSKLVLDLDLSIFALPWVEYETWSQRLEQELKLKYTTIEDIRPLRREFLAKLLKRSNLYYINVGWEELARENIQKDING